MQCHCEPDATLPGNLTITLSRNCCANGARIILFARLLGTEHTVQMLLGRGIHRHPTFAVGRNTPSYLRVRH